jgi:hypothetical protein
MKPTKGHYWRLLQTLLVQTKACFWPKHTKQTFGQLTSAGGTNAVMGDIINFKVIHHQFAAHHMNRCSLNLPRWHPLHGPWSGPASRFAFLLGVRERHQSKPTAGVKGRDRLNILLDQIDLPSLAAIYFLDGTLVSINTGCGYCCYFVVGIAGPSGSLASLAHQWPFAGHRANDCFENPCGENCGYPSRWMPNTKSGNEA